MHHFLTFTYTTMPEKVPLDVPSLPVPGRNLHVHSIDARSRRVRFFFFFGESISRVLHPVASDVCGFYM
jgi:hypothetical protein